MEVDFTQSNMSNSTFDNGNLMNAIIENSILEYCDFRTAYNYRIDVDNNYIKKAFFSLPEVSGLLHKYDITIES